MRPNEGTRLGIGQQRVVAHGQGGQLNNDIDVALTPEVSVVAVGALQVRPVANT